MEKFAKLSEEELDKNHEEEYEYETIDYDDFRPTEASTLYNITDCQNLIEEIDSPTSRLEEVEKKKDLAVAQVLTVFRHICFRYATTLGEGVSNSQHLALKKIGQWIARYYKRNMSNWLCATLADCFCDIRDFRNAKRFIRRIDNTKDKAYSYVTEVIKLRTKQKSWAPEFIEPDTEYIFKTPPKRQRINNWKDHLSTFLAQLDTSESLRLKQRFIGRDKELLKDRLDMFKERTTIPILRAEYYRVIGDFEKATQWLKEASVVTNYDRLFVEEIRKRIKMKDTIMLEVSCRPQRAISY
ncbi:MAG: hypothetical protein MJZ63_05130 [Muribaculaceae bacterium]|nr:hypothetical protein [Muribaculaceae bacterium]